MSKTELALNFEKQAVTQLKAKLLRSAKTDFDAPHNDFGEGYDLRTYYDSGTQQTYYPWIHSKGLTHDATTGWPLKSDVDLLLQARDKATSEAVDAIPLSGGATRKIQNILCGHNFNIIGTDPSPTLDSVSKPAIDSNESAFEMAEVYSKSLLRDISFWNIEQGLNATTTTHVTNLNAFPSKSIAPVDGGLITTKTLHRDSLPGCLDGPYVSQFLVTGDYLNPIRNEVNVPQFRTKADTAGTQDITNWLAIQNGEEPLSTQSVTTPLYIWNARYLMAIGFTESPAQTMAWLTDYILEQGIPLQFQGSDENDAYISGGLPSLHSSIQGVITCCMSTSAHHKWGVNMSLRPEALAQRYHFAETLNGNSQFFDNTPGFQFIKDQITGVMAPFIAEVQSQSATNTALLRLTRGNGSAMDPSKPSMWSVVAAACCTIFKAYLETHDQFDQEIAYPSTIIHSLTGGLPVAYTGTISNTITINGELNKLASNLGQCQSWMGEAFRSCLAYELGEKIAIRFLEDTVRSWHESYDGTFTGFTLTKFDGTFTIIGAQ